MGQVSIHSGLGTGARFMKKNAPAATGDEVRTPRPPNARRRRPQPPAAVPPLALPRDRSEAEIRLGDRSVRLTHLLNQWYARCDDTDRPDYLHFDLDPVKGASFERVRQTAHSFALTLAHAYPDLVTAEYRIADRPADRVLVDYNQNAWGRTLASVYSVRPTPRATVSAPVSWQEVRDGISNEDLRLDNVPARVRERGDLWAPLLEVDGRFALSRLLGR